MLVGRWVVGEKVLAMMKVNNTIIFTCDKQSRNIHHILCEVSRNGKMIKVKVVFFLERRFYQFDERLCQHCWYFSSFSDLLLHEDTQIRVRAIKNKTSYFAVNLY